MGYHVYDKDKPFEFSDKDCFQLKDGFIDENLWKMDGSVYQMDASKDTESLLEMMKVDDKTGTFSDKLIDE